MTNTQSLRKQSEIFIGWLGDGTRCKEKSREMDEEVDDDARGLDRNDSDNYKNDNKQKDQPRV